MPTKLEVCTIPVPEIIAGTQKMLAVPGYAHASFSPKFLMGFLLFGWPLWMYRPNLKSVALPVPEIIATGVLGGGCEPPILGKRRPYGVGDGTVRKSIGKFL